MRDAEDDAPGSPHDLLRSVVEELESIPRLPTSPGERQAAHLIKHRFSRLGWSTVIEEVGAYRSYAWPIGLLCAGSLAAAGAGVRHRRALGTLGGLLAAAGIIDDITGGPMLTRRLFMRRRLTQNVIAEGGNRESGPTR